MQHLIIKVRYSALCLLSQDAEDRGNETVGKRIEWDGTGHTQKGTAAWADGDTLTDDRWKKKVLNVVADNCFTKETALQCD